MNCLTGKTEEWTPFQKGTLPDRTAEDIAEKCGITIEEAKAAIEHDHRDLVAVYVNNLYQVNLYRLHASAEGVPDAFWLSIKRRDKSPVHDWRHFQRIKNEIVGPEYEGVELYPAEDRLVDMANQYHLFVIDDPKFRFPFGFGERSVQEAEHEGAYRQRGRAS